jgi:hypothetical protein
MRLPLFTLLGLALLSFPAMARSEISEGKLSIFRWNKGYRAEREPVFTGKMQETEFRSMVKEGKLPENEEIYSGCYLAHFEANNKTARAPASANEAAQPRPKSEIFRICK